MSCTGKNTPLYYPEDYDYSVYFQNEVSKQNSPVYTSSSSRPNKLMLPTINYFNERKCPIYVHQIKKDSTVYNHYNEKLTDARKTSGVQNNSKFVLDKLEETYWATWKPKKSSGVDHRHMNESFRPHGDNIVKFFKADHFDSNPASRSVSQEATLKKCTEKVTAFAKEIQTELHCPIILEENSAEVVEDEIPDRPEESVKAKQKIKKLKSKKTSQKEVNTDNVDGFLEHKDSIEIAKKKQEKSEKKEHFQQPRCIKLYRKSGTIGGYIKGGTYPLKSALKKNSLSSPRGSFRLGAPGSPLLITNSSSTNRRK